MDRRRVNKFLLLFLIPLFLYIFLNFEVRRDSIQLFSFPVQRPHFDTKPIFLNQYGLDISDQSFAPGIGGEITVGIDLTTLEFADIILDGKKTFRVEKGESINKAYMYEQDGTLTELKIPYHEFKLTKDGQLEPMPDEITNTIVPDAVVTFSLAIGREPGSKVNRAAVSMVKQIIVEPKPWFVPLPFIRSRIPWLVEVETDQGKRTVNKYVYIWR